VEHAARFRVASQLRHYPDLVRFDRMAHDGLIPPQANDRCRAFRQMRLELLLDDEDEDGREEFVFGSAFGLVDSFIFGVTGVTGVTLLVTFGEISVQLRDLVDLRLAHAMLLDRPFDLMRVKLGDGGDFFERKRLELAGLQIDGRSANISSSGGDAFS
jgi:hypothetical protein